MDLGTGSSPPRYRNSPSFSQYALRREFDNPVDRSPDCAKATEKAMKLKDRKEWGATAALDAVIR